MEQHGTPRTALWTRRRCTTLRTRTTGTVRPPKRKLREPPAAATLALMCRPRFIQPFLLALSLSLYAIHCWFCISALNYILLIIFCIAMQGLLPRRVCLLSILFDFFPVYMILSYHIFDVLQVSPKMIRHITTLVQTAKTIWKLLKYSWFLGNFHLIFFLNKCVSVFDWSRTGRSGRKS